MKETKKTAAKATPIKAVAKAAEKAEPVVKAVAAKAEPVAKAVVEKAEPAAKAVAAKAEPVAKAVAAKAEPVAKAVAEKAEPVAKKAATKAATAKKTVAKKATKATTTVKAAAKKAVAKKEEAKICVQFCGKSYTTEELVKIAKDVWEYDLEKKVSDFKTVELFVKPEESVVYYVINGDVFGKFAI